MLQLYALFQQDFQQLIRCKIKHAMTVSACKMACAKQRKHLHEFQPCNGKFAISDCQGFKLHVHVHRHIMSSAYIITRIHKILPLLECTLLIVEACFRTSTCLKSFARRYTGQFHFSTLFNLFLC